MNIIPHTEIGNAYGVQGGILPNAVSCLNWVERIKHDHGVAGVLCETRNGMEEYDKMTDEIIETYKVRIVNLQNGDEC